MMDGDRQQALKEYHQKLRSGLLVENVLPALRPYNYRTDVEYLQVEARPGNVAQGDELVKILLTKENGHFDGFCRVLEQNGYRHWAKQLRAAAGGHKDAEGRCSQSWLLAFSNIATILYCRVCYQL